MSSHVQFLVPAKTTELSCGPIAKPLCPVARYLCLLAKKDKLSLQEIYIVRKIGFSVKILYEPIQE